MRILLILIRILVFIGLSTLNFEYLFNRQSSTLLLILCIIIELLLFWFLLLPLLKKILK